MGTRGIIATPDGDGWRGRYHHWDSYPTGLGATLLEAHAGYFAGDTTTMIEYLVDGEPVGWSTINGADWSLPKGWQDGMDPEAPCALCTLPMWRHYAQYYPQGGPSDPMVNGTYRAGLIKPDEIMQLSHAHERMPDGPKGPQSYSSRGETDDQWLTNLDADRSGAEWCYIITPAGLLVLEGDMGAFGCGGGNWRNPVMVPWGDLQAMTDIETAAYARDEES